MVNTKVADIDLFLASGLFRLLDAAALLIFLAVMPLPKLVEALRREDALEHEKERGGEDPAGR